MKMTVIPADRFISIDGVGYFFDFSTIPGSSGIHAIQWDGTRGHVERPGLPNEEIAETEILAPYIASYQAEVARVAAEKEKAEWEAKHYKWSGTAWVYDITAGKAAALAAIRRSAMAVIKAKYPQWYQSNVANGIYSVEIGDAMRAGIAAVIVESNRCEDLVDAATSEAAVNAVTPQWPKL